MAAVPSRGRAVASVTGELYERYGRRIFSFCLQELGNREEAEDAAQTTFLNAFRGLERGIKPQFEQAWLYAIARNVCLTRRRSAWRRRRVETRGDPEALSELVPSPQADADELFGLPEALRELPEQQRRALLLREWQGLSYKEIGRELSLSQAAVETLLFRARLSLAQGLTAPEPRRGRLRMRLRAGGDAGTLAGLLKTLFLSGGGKVAVSVATVAAGSVVAATPGVRHSVERIVAPAHTVKLLGAAPVQAPKQAPVVALRSSRAVAAAPVRTSTATPLVVRPVHAPHVLALPKPAPRVHRQPTAVKPTHAPAVPPTAAPTAPPAAVPAAEPAAAPAVPAATPAAASPPRMDTPVATSGAAGGDTPSREPSFPVAPSGSGATQGGAGPQAPETRTFDPRRLPALPSTPVPSEPSTPAEPGTSSDQPVGQTTPSVTPAPPPAHVPAVPDPSATAPQPAAGNDPIPAEPPYPSRSLPVPEQP